MSKVDFMRADSAGTIKRVKLFLIIPLVLIYVFAMHKFRRDIITVSLFIRQAELLTLLFAFVLLHLLFDIRTLYEKIFRFRVLIALALLVFFVANNINASSINVWNRIIESSAIPGNSNCILGIPRDIRSDEWNVNVSRMLSGSYNDYGEYNDIVRGVSTENISASGLYRDYSALAKPYYYGYYLFDFSHGLAFQWAYVYIFGFLFAFELFYILTGKKLAGLLGANLLWLSPLNLWWSVSIPLLSMSALPVLFYYTLRADSRWKRLLFALMLAVGGADFVCVFYPAWQVPAGWIILTLMVYFLYRYREWKSYHLLDWAVIVGAVVFMASIILRYVIADMSYIKAVAETVYPGARYDSGEMSMQKLLGYAPYYFVGFARNWNISPNNSEGATFALAFPLAYILLPLALVLTGRRKTDSGQGSGAGKGRSGRREIVLEDNGSFESRRRLLIFLLFPLVLLTLYCTTGLPAIVAKVLLLDRSTGARTVDFLGALLVVIMVVSITIIRDMGGLSWYWSLLIAVGSVLPAYFYGLQITAHPTGPVVEAGTVLSALIIFLLLVSYKRQAWNAAILCTGYFLAVCGFSVNPLTLGTSVITDKPIAAAIRNLVAEDEDALWISSSENRFIANFLIANGARTINSINYIPNMSLWKKLDPDGSEEEIYNRYAQVTICLEDTEDIGINLEGIDAIDLTIGPKDFDTLGATYVLATDPIDSSFANELQLIYQDEARDVFIYKNLELD